MAIRSLSAELLPSWGVKGVTVDLKDLVERTIDFAIREFNPDDRDSYNRWDHELERVEEALRSSPAQLDPTLLSSICAARIRVAFEVGDFDVVISRTADFLDEFPASLPSFSLAASLRVSALHAVEAHEEEVREALKIGKMPEIGGSEYVYLLAGLSKRHPGCLPEDVELWEKLQQAVDDLREQGYDQLPQVLAGPTRVEESAQRIADDLRRINQQLGEALLTEQP